LWQSAYKDLALDGPDASKRIHGRLDTIFEEKTPKPMRKTYQ
jgi:hypothetical protein